MGAAAVRTLAWSGRFVCVACSQSDRTKRYTVAETGEALHSVVIERDMQPGQWQIRAADGTIVDGGRLER
jgi:hypothetical protein